ncbi:MAG TPA: hypothetical protein VGM68_11715 [Rhizomicrobium sp.]|jgi:uncharacterized membrane protein YgcG
MRNLDFSSFQGAFLTLLGLAVVTLIGVGVRLLMMTTVQQRRERMNRQINERLKTLISAYKVLGGSFTGELSVHPIHLRDINAQISAGTDGAATAIQTSERSRRIRDAVEGAISDILLLGNERHVRLAERAARDLVAGRPIETHELVVSLREFIREALDLDPLPADIVLPPQGPARAVSSNGRNKSEQGKGEGQGGGKSGGGMGGLGGGTGFHDDAEPPEHNA